MRLERCGRRCRWDVVAGLSGGCGRNGGDGGVGFRNKLGLRGLGSVYHEQITFATTKYSIDLETINPLSRQLVQTIITLTSPSLMPRTALVPA